MKVPYRGRHAALYDLFYADKPYPEEARFVREQLLAHAQGPVRRVLDLACGTGSHALALSRLGLEVTGVDLSPDMLAQARAKLQAGGAHADLFEQDLRRLELPGAPWDAAVCLFDSLGYLLDNASLLEALRRARSHVREGGLLALELWHAAAFLRGYEATRVRRWPHPHGELVRLSETTLQCSLQQAQVRYTIWEPGPTGTTVIEETQVNRYFQALETELLLRATGWRLLRLMGGFDVQAPISDRAWHLVALARREDD